jgi:hypothetical protein
MSSNNSGGSNHGNSDRGGFFNNSGGGNNNNMNNMGNCGNNGGGGGGGNNNGGPYLVHLRGMPYDCAEMEIQQFFAPLKLVNCVVLFNNGEAISPFLISTD